MKIVMDRSKSGKKQSTNFTLKNRLISLYFDMNRICTRVKMSIYSLWIYTGSVLECSGWAARVIKGHFVRCKNDFRDRFSLRTSEALYKLNTLLRSRFNLDTADMEEEEEPHIENPQLDQSLQGISRPVNTVTSVNTVTLQMNPVASFVFGMISFPIHFYVPKILTCEKLIPSFLLGHR